MRNIRFARKGRLASGLLLGGLTLFIAPATSGLPLQNAGVQPVSFDIPAQIDNSANAPVRDATARFLEAMRDGDAGKIWTFSSEEDQDAFGTEAAVYQAFAETFPVLTSVSDVAFQSFVTEGDTQLVGLVVMDASHAQYRAQIGFSLSDANDWQVVSCDITRATDQIAGL